MARPTRPEPGNDDTKESLGPVKNRFQQNTWSF